MAKLSGTGLKQLMLIVFVQSTCIEEDLVNLPFGHRVGLNVLIGPGPAALEELSPFRSLVQRQGEALP